MFKDSPATIYDCIVVGAGAAGLFYAAADDSGGSKLVIEKTSCPGQKLLLSGSGSCNITHSGSIKDFITHYADKGKSIRSCLYRHNNLELMKFMEDAGVPMTQRPDGKVFPASMKADDVLDALLAKAYRNGYRFLYDHAATAIDCGGSAAAKSDTGGSAVSGQAATGLTDTGGPAESEVAVILTDGRALRTRKLVIATGGASFPATGSDGSFLEIIRRDLGLAITKLKPALAPVYVENYPYRSLAGVSFEDVEVTCAGHTARGPMLLTHRGFSGPAILHISQYANPGQPLVINYLPRYNSAVVFRRLRDDQKGCSKGTANYLARQFGLPKAFAETLCTAPAGKLSGVASKELESMVRLMTEQEHTVSGTGGFREAMVTAGGVALHEVNMKNMSLIKYPCIHVIGEALDINGDTGGYNLQFAYSSARAAI